MLAGNKRVDRLPHYTAAELVLAKRRLVQRGADVIDLGMGDLAFSPPEIAVRTLRDAITDPDMSRYGFQSGLGEFREAIARYMSRRFTVRVDPQTEVLPLLGSKEGLANMAHAVLDSGDACVLPDPGYPAYAGGVVLTDAQALTLPLTADADFLLQLDSLPARDLSRVRLAYVNYPNNPTTAIAPRGYLERLVELCGRHGIALAYDNPYCDITFDGYRAPSILEIPGARDVAVEFHSFSKSFAMAGWRLGWAVGNADLIARLTRVKTFVDTGSFLALQAAGAAVLDDAEAASAPIRDALVERRDVAVALLRDLGLTIEPPKATLYMWVPLPEGVSSAGVTRRLLEDQALMLMPGSAFGTAGDGYLRLSLTVEPERLREAAHRIEWSGVLSGSSAVRA